MSDNSLGKQIDEFMGSTAARWTGYSAMGSFVIYVLGYLALRFQLMALGVGTDLHLVDERYLFEGAKFLVYILATVPVAVLLLLPLLPAGWLIGRLVPAARQWPAYIQARPLWCLLGGIVLSVAFIQLVARKCLLFDNLLLRDALPGPSWFEALLTASPDSDVVGQLYFTALLVAIALTGGLALASRPRDAAPLLQRGLWGLLNLLVAIQVLLLPVNYGILIGARPMPRLSMSGNESALEPESTNWLIWEGTQGVTLVVAEPNGKRRLSTLPRDRLKQVDIVGYDALSKIRSYSPGPNPNLPSKVQKGPYDNQPVRFAWADLAMVMGIGASPRMQKAPPGDRVRGDVFLLNTQGTAPAERLTSGGGFHSPIFLPGDEKLLALEDDRLVKIDLAGGDPRTLATLEGAARLIGVHPHRPDEVLALIESKSLTQLVSFNLEAKRLTTVIDTAPTDDRDKTFTWYALGESRNYDDVRVFVERRTNDVSTWWDVFIQRADQPAQNLSQGNGNSSRQPALSHDGRRIAFVSESGK